MGAAALLVAAIACHDAPAAPSSLAAGRWSGDGACLSVSDQECDFVAGCGHGRFPPPAVSRNGTFDVQGTYRIEVGPISVDPAPPAAFAGVLRDNLLTLTVTPADTRIARATYVLRVTTGSGRCTVPCL